MQVCLHWNTAKSVRLMQWRREKRILSNESGVEQWEELGYSVHFSREKVFAATEACLSWEQVPFSKYFGHTGSEQGIENPQHRV